MLWQREDLATLRSFASAPGFVARSLGMDHVVAIERWMVRFPPAVPARLSPRSGKGTYHIKPLVAIHDEPLFGELAIVRCLQQDGWSAVWVDTFHGAELFWDALPDRSRPVAFAEDSGVLATYRQIVSANGRRGGFFDVLAWRECEFLFIEYKGKGDTANANEAAWIEAALSCGVITTQLLFAVHA